MGQFTSIRAKNYRPRQKVIQVHAKQGGAPIPPGAANIHEQQNINYSGDRIPTRER